MGKERETSERTLYSGLISAEDEDSPARRQNRTEHRSSDTEARNAAYWHTLCRSASLSLANQTETEQNRTVEEECPLTTSFLLS